MKKITLIAALATATILLSGCNTTAPTARVDKTDLTKKLSFKLVKIAYVRAFYNKKPKLQKIYWQWLQDNKERVNPFLNLKKWQKIVEKQYKKDSDYIASIQKNVEKMDGYQLKKALANLLHIKNHVAWNQIDKTRLLIVKKYNKELNKVAPTLSYKVDKTKSPYLQEKYKTASEFLGGEVKLLKSIRES